MKKLWVYLSYDENGTDSMSIALLTRAKQLAEEKGYVLQTVSAGEQAETIAREAADYGVETAIAVVGQNMTQQDYMLVSEALKALVETEQPDIFLFPATDSASFAAGALGVKLHTGVNVHCVSAEIRDGIFIGTVPAFGGQAMSEILCPSGRPQIATVRLIGGRPAKGKPGMVVRFLAPQCTQRIPKLEKVYRPDLHGGSLTDAELVVCGGAGLQDSEGWNLLQELATRLNAGLGCTRDALDLDIGAAEKNMIGISGTSVHPKLYLGFGISGAAHHVLGMKDSAVVLNVNSSRKNGFFSVSDCGYVGDAKAVIKELLKKLNS